MSGEPESTEPLRVVYYAGVDWSYTWQRSQQLASRIAALGTLLYVDPLGLRSPRAGDWSRLAGRIRRAPWRGDELPSGLALHRPILYWPYPEHDAGRRLNARRLSAAALSWMNRQGAGSPVVWLGSPSRAAWDAAASIPSARLVYDCADDVPALHPGHPSLVETERGIARAAHTAFAASSPLFDRMKALNPRTFLLRNGVDAARFQPQGQGFGEPSDLRGLPRPIIGYVGEIASWFDFDLVSDLAQSQPRSSIVLIGPVHERAAARQMARHANVTLLGRRPYSEVPAYLSFFSVCILPFKVTPATTAANPVKLYEYLAAGKPVVSTPLPEVAEHADLVRIAARDSFSRCVGEALIDPDGGAQQRVERAAANSWDARIDLVRQRLMERP